MAWQSNKEILLKSTKELKQRNIYIYMYRRCYNHPFVVSVVDGEVKQAMIYATKEKAKLQKSSFSMWS